MDVTSYLLGKKSGGGQTINNQNKDITINQNGTTSVSADAGYTGLGTVGITTNVTPDTETKSVTITENTTTVIEKSANKDGMTSVSVTTNVEPDLETKSVTITENGTTTITPTTGKDGMSEVEVITDVSGGGDLSEYFDTTLGSGSSESRWYEKLVKKLPAIVVDTSNGGSMFREYTGTNLNVSFNKNLTNMSYMFYQCTKLLSIPQIPSQDVTDMSNAFEHCDGLTVLPQLDCSSVKNMNSMFTYSKIVNMDCSRLDLSNNNTSGINMNSLFAYSSTLETISGLNTSKATSISSMFNSCYALKNVPIFDLSNINNTYSLSSVFNYCDKLTDTSLDNVLQSCISATKYTGTKTFALVFGTSNSVKKAYPASRIQALPHYQDFLDAGWTIGY